MREFRLRLLIAILTVSRTIGNKSNLSQFGVRDIFWELTEDGKRAKFSIDPNNSSRLLAPDLRPLNFSALEVIGGDQFQSAVMPFFGEIHNTAGIGGTVIALSPTERIQLRTYSNSHPRVLRVFGSGTGVTLGKQVHLFFIK